MEIREEIFIAAPPDEVYAALNDPAILQDCIPGCEALEKTSDTTFAAQVVLKIGPVKAKFKGTVTLHPDAPPARFSLTGEGNGGVAGFAKGGADVTLTAQDGGTLLAYDAKAQIGGKLAQLGSRVVQGSVKKLAAQFFDAFAEKLAPPAA